MSIVRIQAVFVSLLAVALAACASSPAATSSGTSAAATPASTPATSADENTIPVTVNYNMPDQGPITVYIEPTGGIQALLGTVQPNEQKTFTYRVTNSRQLKLIARSDVGASNKESPQATVPTGQGVTWNMAVNRMQLVRR
jgi:hypothetical protein